MKVAGLEVDATTVLVGGAIAVGAYLLYQHRDWFNPVSRDNVAYGGVNAVGGALSGNDDWTLGTWLYDITHPYEEYEMNPEGAPLWWLLQNPEYANSDTIAGG